MLVDNRSLSGVLNCLSCITTSPSEMGSSLTTISFNLWNDLLLFLSVFECWFLFTFLDDLLGETLSCSVLEVLFLPVLLLDGISKFDAFEDLLLPGLLVERLGDIF